LNDELKPELSRLQSDFDDLKKAAAEVVEASRCAQTSAGESKCSSELIERMNNAINESLDW
jgi:hypothetical protein